MSMYGKRVTTHDSSEGGPSLTKQSFSDVADINKIIARYEKTGMVENLNSRQPFYGDVSAFVSYKDSLDIVNGAQALFMAMDANVRARFENDPQKMIDFLDDPANIDEAIELGMAVKRPVEPPAPVKTKSKAPGKPQEPVSESHEA